MSARSFGLLGGLVAMVMLVLVYPLVFLWRSFYAAWQVAQEDFDRWSA
jgi:hypothetical protein